MLRALGAIPGLLFHFLTSLLQRGKLCSKLLFHFLTSFLQRKETMLMIYVSFFKELATEKRKLCLWTLLDHGFQENNALEKHHVKGQISIMASKISSLDGIKSL
jgi:hypothetical protein